MGEQEVQLFGERAGFEHVFLEEQGRRVFEPAVGGDGGGMLEWLGGLPRVS